MDNLFISFAGVDHNIEKYELDLKIYNCRIYIQNPYHRSTPVAITEFEQPCSNALNLPWPSPQAPQQHSSTPESDVQRVAAPRP
jgi:hypothetical protein